MSIKEGNNPASNSYNYRRDEDIYRFYIYGGWKALKAFTRRTVRGFNGCGVLF
jgi:hypothetical protein